MLLASSKSPTRPAVASSLTSYIGSVGALAGPYLFSILIDYTSLSLLPLACMLLLLLQGVFFLRMPGRPVEDEEHLPKRMKEKRLESEHGVVCP